MWIPRLLAFTNNPTFAQVICCTQLTLVDYFTPNFRCQWW